MPPPTSRSRPFSAKQKKEQLREKRERKDQCKTDGEELSTRHRHSKSRGAAVESQPADLTSTAPGEAGTTVRSLKDQRDAQRYRLQFMTESKEEIAKRKLLSMQPYQLVRDASLEADPSAFYPDGVLWEFPKRPKWCYSLTTEQLEKNEQKYFQNYLEAMRSAHSEGLSYFEMNLETWRQLWRVLEMSDVLLLIADVRFAALHVPRFVCDYIVNDLKKDVVIVLNKIDIVPASVVAAWEAFLQTRFPGVRIVNFTSYPRKLEEQVTMLNPHTGKVTMKKKRIRRAPAVGPMELWHTIEELVRPAGIDIADWRAKIEEDMRVETQWDDDNSADEVKVGAEVLVEKLDLGFVDHSKYKDGIVTIGCIGYPNVGKSSVINGLMGKKVVSVSKTPGHTKHFQTIFLTDNVKLCDCPGLVFPSCVPKELQVLSGLYPVAQLREPYSAVQYLAERIPLPQLLGIDKGDRGQPWSAFDICDAWAEKRGFRTAKTGRTDTYRSANNILQMALQGKLVLFIRPPGYSLAADEWARSSRSKQISAQQDEHRQIVANTAATGDGSGSDGDGSAVGAVVSSHASSDESADDNDPGTTQGNMYDLLSSFDNC